LHIFRIKPEENQEHVCMNAVRQNFATVELNEEKVRAIAKARMQPRHKHLDELLPDKAGRTRKTPRDQA
jgi:hypothetical protein